MWSLDVSSNKLVAHPRGHAICSTHGLSLGLAPFIAYGFAGLMFHVPGGFTLTALHGPLRGFLQGIRPATHGLASFEISFFFWPHCTFFHILLFCFFALIVNLAKAVGTNHATVGMLCGLEISSSKLV
jgi:hypothetical protein